MSSVILAMLAAIVPAALVGSVNGYIFATMKNDPIGGFAAFVLTALLAYGPIAYLFWRLMT